MIDTYFNKLKVILDKIDRQEILQVCELIGECKGNIFVFGNGGSAATASHFAQDMNKCLNARLICLNDNIPSLLAYGNDVNFESVFKLQLEKLIKEGDLVIGISCSGNSPNVLSAIEFANNNHIYTIGFTGYDGGILRTMVNLGLYVPCNDMQICEDCHLILTHVIMKILKK